jgi:hypothetical protein
MPSTRARSQLFQSNYVKIEDMYITKDGTLGDGSSGDVLETDGSGNLRWVAKTDFTLEDLSDFNAAGDTGQILTLQSDDTFAMEWYSWNDLTDKPTNISTWTNDSGYITDYTVTESDVTAHQAALSITESQISDLQSYLTSVAFTDLTDLNASSATAGQILTAQSDGTFAFDWVDVTLDPDARVQTLDFIDSSDVVQATLSWNDIEGTLDIAYENGVILQVGQEEHFYVKATEAIANGDIVMFAGAQGDHLLIAKADMGNSTFAPEFVIGVATQSFANNEFGYVTSFGKVRGLDTTDYDEGDILYLDPDTAGGWTTTVPSPPDHIIQVAAVTRSHGQHGTIFVRPTHKPDTDEVPEGQTNLYYTDTRVNALFSSLERSLVPATTNLYDIGSASKEWKDLYVKTIASDAFDTDGSNIDIVGSATIGGTTTIGGSILPDADIAYDLGSENFRFRDLYLSGSSIVLGGITLSASTDGKLETINNSNPSDPPIEYLTDTHSKVYMNTYTATANQTSFNATYEDGKVLVFRNGIKIANTELTATNGVSVTLSTACEADDVVEVIGYS